MEDKQDFYLSTIVLITACIVSIFVVLTYCRHKDRQELIKSGAIIIGRTGAEKAMFVDYVQKIQEDK